MNKSGPKLAVFIIEMGSRGLEAVRDKKKAVADKWGEAIISCLKPMPMVLQTDSDVKDDLDKDQINAPVTMMTKKWKCRFSQSIAEEEEERGRKEYLSKDGILHFVLIHT